MRQTEDEFPKIVLTEKSKAVLKGEIKVDLVKVKEVKQAKPQESSLPYFADLLENLKSVRFEIAKKENVPPYIVFSDATLVEMATYLPQNYSELKKISGVGDLKLQKYGVDFLPQIISYSRQNHLSSKINLKRIKREQKKQAKLDDTNTISLKLFKSGKSIEEIAELRDLNKGTIETHLIKFIPSGEVKLDDLVGIEKAANIVKAIVRFGESEALSPIKEFLGEEYSYGEIKAVLVAMQT